MAVTGVDITRRESYAGKQSFGDVGAYERIDGVQTFAVVLSVFLQVFAAFCMRWKSEPRK